ncbi:hypothetical protein [Hymenobacter canadensis]|uniref:Entericidin n=1 Tax=Hymenobacter canadensis TaxID=2999067 RepID=A0ABY7LPD9_9BACT|nr:hypothetical protein [Hymenobacter canadensis]WBA41341.1 hypothetical protein O3303_16155 [Hymenobacter canadensis]
MKTRFFSFALLMAALSFSSCGEKRTDGTAGEAVSNMDEAAANGGVEADATVIDNEAGPTVTASPDSAMAADSSTMAQ